MTIFREWRYWLVLTIGLVGTSVIEAGHHLIGSLIIGGVIGGTYSIVPTWRRK